MCDVEFRVLGPLELWVGGKLVPLGGARQQIVLGALLLADGQVVSLCRLVDAVWDYAPPATADKQIRNTVSGLRHLLVDIDSSITTVASGYRLEVAGGAFDVNTFTVQSALARGHAVEDRVADAIAEFRSALSVWRGPALAGVDSPALQAQVVGLNEQRLAVMEDCVELELAEGKHSSLTNELFTLVAENPHRERLVAQLMLVLYRSGAQARALAVYEQTRETLADELGVDPGPELQELRRRLLANDLAAAQESVTWTGPVARSTLPADISDFTGRAAELDQLVDMLPTQDGGATATTVIAIDGMPGVGKTALAVHAAHKLVPHFPDAQLFVDLHAHTADHDPLAPAVVLGGLLRAVDVPADKIPSNLADRSAMWRANLADRRALLVLDNVADTAQIRPLLPGSPGCLTLVTSRHRLTGLDGAQVLSLDMMPEADERDLFRRVIGDGRPAAEPGAVADVLAHCGHLPLAIRIAAARLRHRPTWTVAHLAARLADNKRRLAELRTEDRSVAVAFGLSYRSLTSDYQRLFRLLGLVTRRDIDRHAAAALADLPASRAEHLLEGLVDAHLLRQHAPGRYCMHRLLQAYSAQLVADADDQNAAVSRLCKHYLRTVDVGVLHPTPQVTFDRHHPPAWLAADHGWSGCQDVQRQASVELGAPLLRLRQGARS